MLKYSRDKGFKISKNLTILFLLICSLFFIILINLKNEEINNLNNNYSVLIDNYNNLKKSYNSSLLIISEKEQELSTLIYSYQNLSNNFDTFKSDIQEQLNIFKNNNNIINHSSYYYISRDLRKCYYVSLDYCEIKLQCIYFIDTYQDFGYNLKYISEEENPLFDLDEFLSRGGGDCDDWALAFTAQYNYLKQKCLSLNKKIKLKAVMFPGNNWVTASFLTDLGWENANEKTWYNYINAYPLCGKNPKDDVGHCWVVFTKEEINNSSDIDKIISDAHIIEPQGGFYEISTEEAINNDNWEFWIIILPNDLGYKKENNWVTYNNFLDEINNKIKTINEILD